MRRLTINQARSFGIDIPTYDATTGKRIVRTVSTKTKTINKVLTKSERKKRNRKERNTLSKIHRKTTLTEIEQYELEVREQNRSRLHNLDHVAQRSKAIAKSFVMARDTKGKSGQTIINLNSGRWGT